ncbi:MAG: peptidylprolyl isomerase [Polyangiaceae bacterium]
MRLPNMVVDGLIERELLVREADKLGIGVGDDNLDSELTQGRAHVSLPVAATDMLGARLGLCVPNPLTYACAAGTHTFRILPVKRAQDGRFDSKIYERVVRTYTNRGPKQFRDMQTREVIAARMRNLVRSRVRVSREEAFEVYQRTATNATVEYVTLDRDWFARYVVNLAPAAIDAWAEGHKEQVDDAVKSDKDRFVAGCTLVSEISFPFTGESTDAEKTALRGRADAALERLKKDKVPFEVVARQSSLGDNAVYGGYIGCLNESYGTGSKELMDAVAQLKDHDVSGVVESARGFHVLRLEGKLAEADIDATVRRAAARRLSVRFLADEAMQSFATKLLDKAKSTAMLKEALDPLLAELVPASKAGDKSASPALADESRPQVKNSTPFTADGTPGPEFSPYSGVAGKILALDKPGALLSEPVATADRIRHRAAGVEARGHA